MWNFLLCKTAVTQPKHAPDMCKGPGFPYLRAGMEAGAQKYLWLWGMVREAGIFLCHNV